MIARTLLVAWALLAPALAQDLPRFDVLIRGGTIVDGSGGPPFRGDVAIRGDRVVAVGEITGAAELVCDATGRYVAPGFVNVLSWATRSILVDPRALSDVLQGVTLEIFGEGTSMGPLNPAMREQLAGDQGALAFEVAWTTLGGYLEHLERRGVGVNVASLVGAATLRIHELGHEDLAPTAAELARMQDLARAAMREGALGVGSALIYAPGVHASTAELVALARAVGEYGGVYVSHLRSEGNRLLEAVDELIHIAREAGVAGHVYHLKAAGKDNWGKLEQVVERVEAARRAGVRVTADVYTYTAGATGLDAAMPPWVQTGGFGRWRNRLTKAEHRARVAEEMRTPSDEWENLYLAAGGAEHVLLVGFKNDRLAPLIGRTLADVASERGTTPEEAAMDLVVEDGSRVDCVYFMMSEDNLRRKVALPWVMFCSDASAPAPDGAFLRNNVHPRAYGSFARVLGRFVRDEGVLSLPDAVRKLSALPADTFGLRDRGRLRPGGFADVVVFDLARVADHATYAEPHRLAAGVEHVFVNGRQVVRGGEHTGVLPGRFVRGPGFGRD